MQINQSIDFVSYDSQVFTAFVTKSTPVSITKALFLIKIALLRIKAVANHRYIRNSGGD